MDASQNYDFVLYENVLFGGDTFSVEKETPFGLVLRYDTLFPLMYAVTCSDHCCGCATSVFIVTGSGPKRPIVEVVNFFDAQSKMSVSNRLDFWFDKKGN
jgi:hypothetical protein